MANLKVNNYHNLKLRINRDEYWDFFVNKDVYGSFKMDGLYDNCLISYIDMCDSECTDGSEWVYSKSNYVWNEGIANPYTLYNISYTGVDNGLFKFRKDRISNKDFVKLFQENKYEIKEDDKRLKLHAVSGNTLQYEYPLQIDECEAKFNGGFFQGFFETECDKYQVLPSKFNSGDNLHFEFTLKKCDLEPESDKTLNDKYPENKGIFFYIGTRSENKWIYQYDKDDVDGLEECYQLDMDDFVEDSKIDKKDYIIGNFYSPNPDFDGYDPFELGDYTNYNYYDDELYADDYCDWNDMYDYLEIETEKKPKVIDETNKHTTLTWCCGEIDSNSYGFQSFFNGCGCQVRYKKVKKKDDPFDPNPLKMGTEFGDGYIVDASDLMSVEEAMDYIEAELDISDFVYYTDNGLSLFDANQYYFYTDNKFLMFDRTKSGYTTKNWVEGTQMMYYGRRSQFTGNLFILMNRTKTGYTVNNIDKLRDQSANNYNPYNSLYNNALAFRITDKGEIGYRMLSIDCNKEGRDKTTVIEGYSFENVVPDCEWTTINVRLQFFMGKMKIMFYVAGKLVYISQDLPQLNLRKLDELYDKQEGIPYSISIGGGTQGLAETIQPNYMLNPTRTYPIEKNFAGSFIGYISSFRAYNCFMEQMVIENNYKYEKNKRENKDIYIENEEDYD